MAEMLIGVGYGQSFARSIIEQGCRRKRAGWPVCIMKMVARNVEDSTWSE